MEDQKHGIEETKEAIKGVLTLTSFVGSRLKDGLEIDDAIALAQKLFMDAEFKKVLEDAVKGASLIDDEVKELSFVEAAEIVKLLLDEVPKLIDALKKAS